jgi:ketosteroid isomerase-like protein
MSENLDLLRSIYAAWERGDYYSSVEWAHPEIEFVVMDGPSPGSLTGVAAVEDNWREFQQAWEDYRIKADEYRQLDGDRVLALVRVRGRGKTSGLEMEKAAANIFTIRFGRVTRLVMYWDRETAFGDLGLEG